MNCVPRFIPENKEGLELLMNETTKVGYHGKVFFLFLFWFLRKNMIC